MRFKAITKVLGEDKRFSSAVARLKTGREITLKSPDAGVSCVVDALLEKTSASVLVVAPRPDAADRVFVQLQEWFGPDANIAHFVDRSGLVFERHSTETFITHERICALAYLRSEKPAVVVASIQAVAETTISENAFVKGTIRIEPGTESGQMGGIIRSLIVAGYHPQPTVSAPGEFSRRGGILDVFSVGSEAPTRLEFFGDEIEELREFDPITQRSVRTLKSLNILPASESLRLIEDFGKGKEFADLLLKDPSGNLYGGMHGELTRLMDGDLVNGEAVYDALFQFGSVTDHFPKTGTVVLLRPGEIEQEAAATDYRRGLIRSKKIERGEIPAYLPSPQMGWEEAVEKIKSVNFRVGISPWGTDIDSYSQGPGRSGIVELPFASPTFRSTSMAESVGNAAELARSGTAVVMASVHGPRIKEILEEKGNRDVISKTLVPGSVVLVESALREGFTLNSGTTRIALLTNAEIIGVSKERPVGKKRYRAGVSLERLEPGCLVVHIEHGIARFTGVRTIEGDNREFLVLQYADKDRLYIPTEQVERIQLYKGAKGVTPKLTRLGTQEWKRAKRKVGQAAEEIAGELLNLYAAKQLARRTAFDRDTPWQTQMEGAFPYEETTAQAQAISDVKLDMESDTPMDRLVCGDVGYGKTEVALRAAFKAVESGRQVAILAPTTILAKQHYETFKERLGPFPIRVEMLSRLRSVQEQREVVQGASNGSVDILVGTHRILQKDVSFRNLGFLVVDEEHKFGVAHKERFRKQRANLDVLALSATPIPRTLYMALSGVRDMSPIDTPPEDRLPIKTYVGEESDEVIREAILRELDRGGQTFVLLNRVRDIDLFAARIQRIVPEASIAIGHGQMERTELESVMDAFTNREKDVLICTTIIESGLDLPNVNTIVMVRADMLGLAQMYQIRGRVGRSGTRAYAYLLVPRGRRLPEKTERRLNTILEATKLGAGLEIARSDLELRGVGNILGSEQSGHIASVGFTLYSQLLSDAVNDVRSHRTRRWDEPSLPQVTVDVGDEPTIPQSYIEDISQRLAVYRKLSLARTDEDVRSAAEETSDRFGKHPARFVKFLDKVRIRLLAEEANMFSVKLTEEEAIFRTEGGLGGISYALSKVLDRQVKVGHSTLTVPFCESETNTLEATVNIMRGFIKFRDDAIANLKDAEAKITRLVTQN